MVRERTASAADGYATGPAANPTRPADSTPTPDHIARELTELLGVDRVAKVDTGTLGETIVTLSAHIHVANHRLLILLAELDRRGGWKPAGHRSCAHRLASRTGISLGAARERVRVARALHKLTKTSAAMARGELSCAEASEGPEKARADGAENVSAETSSGAGRCDNGSRPANREAGICGAGGGASCPAPISGTRPERYQVVLHVDGSTLRANGEPDRSHLSDGTRVSAETSRRLSCDAGVVRATRGPRGPRGEVLDMGRRTRTVPPALRRALEIRDGGVPLPRMRDPVHRGPPHRPLGRRR